MPVSAGERCFVSAFVLCDFVFRCGGVVCAAECTFGHLDVVPGAFVSVVASEGRCCLMHMAGHMVSVFIAVVFWTTCEEVCGRSRRTSASDARTQTSAEAYSVCLCVFCRTTRETEAHFHLFFF